MLVWPLVLPLHFTLNRTRLELKHDLGQFLLLFLASLNRTRLELKPGCRKTIALSCCLLIAPDWNWNTWSCKWWIGKTLTLNRTRLELKHVAVVVERVLNAALNRTRLELKLVSSSTNVQLPPSLNRTRLELKHNPSIIVSLNIRDLLIAPDWNWNFFARPYYLGFDCLLIAPDWNWNSDARHSCKSTCLSS